MKHLFIDRQHVQRLDRVQRRFHHPTKDAGPVLAPAQPWEGERLHLWNAPVWCPERKRWRMWYIGGEELLPLYAESEDGLHWQRPHLERVVWNGSCHNNIVNLGFEAYAKERRLVLLRDDRDPDPARRYKALTRVSGRLIGLISPDGLDWSALSPLSAPDHFDTGAIHALAPVVSGDELWFYYYGARFTHLKRSVIEEAGLRAGPDEPIGAIFRARLRLDGFASLSAGAEPGAVLTRPVRVEGRNLYVNADAARGKMRIELRDAETGRVIPGYGMGDAMWRYHDYSETLWRMRDNLLFSVHRPIWPFFSGAFSCHVLYCPIIGF